MLNVRHTLEETPRHVDPCVDVLIVNPGEHVPLAVSVTLPPVLFVTIIMHVVVAHTVAQNTVQNTSIAFAVFAATSAGVSAAASSTLIAVFPIVCEVAGSTAQQTIAYHAK